MSPPRPPLDKGGPLVAEVNTLSVSSVATESTRGEEIKKEDNDDPLAGNCYGYNIRKYLPTLLLTVSLHS